MTAPRRQLTLFDAVCVIVGVIIGAGIYEVAPTVASAADTPLGVIGLWILGGLISLCGALCYAELACAYPRAGGDYEYLTRAYGPWAGFLFGWFLVTLIRPGDIALLALVFARYALAIAPDVFPDGLSGWWYRALAVGGVVLLTVVNVLGVRHGKRLQNVLTTVKVLALLAIILLAFIGTRYATTLSSSSPAAPLDRGAESSERVPQPSGEAAAEEAAAEEAGAEEAAAEEAAENSTAESDVNLAGAAAGTTFGLAMIFVLFTYGGWNEMAYLAAEMERPEKNILRGLVVGSCGVMSIYVLLNVAFLYSLGLGGLTRSEAVGVDAVAGALPTLGQALISAAICISALGAVSGLIFTGSRIAYAIGQDYPLFSYLGQWHPRSETPMRALIVQAVISTLMILILGEFIETLIYTSAAVYCFFLASCLAVIVLRWKDPHVARPYRVIGYPWTVLVFAGACLYLLYSAITYRPFHGLALIGMLLLGCVIYAFQGPPRRVWRKSPPPASERSTDEQQHE